MKNFARGSAVLFLSLVTALPAYAGIEFEEVQTTMIPLSEGVRPDGRILVDAEGDTFYISRSQEDEGFGAYLYRADLGGTEHTEIVYNFQETPTQATSWTFGPGGDLCLRVLVTPPQEADIDPFGATVRMTRDGDVNWEVHDEAFGQDEDFIGSYVGPAGPIAYSPVAQRLLVFSEASFEISGVSQGSLLFEFNGEVRDPSIVFGEEYIGSTLGSAVATPDGKFLIFYFSTNQRGTRFFLFNGISDVEFFRPEGGDWMQRRVYQVQVDPDSNYIILWSELDEEQDVSRAQLTKIAPDGTLIWSTDLAGSTEITLQDPMTGEMMTTTEVLERPVFMVSGKDILLLRRAGPTFVADARSGEDGSALGFQDFFSITDLAITDLVFLNGSDSDFLLNTFNPEDPTAVGLLQVRLTVNEDPVVITNNGAPNNGANNGVDNNGSADAGTDGPFGPRPDADSGDPSQPDVGCDCAVTSSSANWPAVLLIGFVMMFVARRRRPTP